MTTLCTLALAACVAACTRSEKSPTSPDQPPLTSEQEATSGSRLVDPFMLMVPTYDKSGQSVHPDVVDFGASWHGSPLWLTMTPYPFGQNQYENPSVLVSSDGTTLAVPAGIVNPIVAAPGFSNYNSDPDLTYDAAHDRLVMSYRVVHDTLNTIMITSTADGRAWTPARVAFEERAHSAVSQSITPAEDGHPAMAWYVDAGLKGCGAASAQVLVRTGDSNAAPLDSTDWSSSSPTNLNQPNHVVWHLKVRYVPSHHEYWAIYVAYPADGGSCSDDDLFFARSADGVHWTTYARPLLRHEFRTWTYAALYRGSFLYDAGTDQLRLWFSSRDKSGAWHMGYAVFKYATFEQQLASASHSLAPANSTGSRSVRTNHPDWTDWP